MKQDVARRNGFPRSRACVSVATGRLASPPGGPNSGTPEQAEIVMVMTEEAAAPQGAEERARAALIVAHGQPSDPEPAEAEVAALAARVAGHLPGWTVLSATLAAEGALAAAVERAGGREVVVYPLFMADGWFTQTHLPARLAAAGATGARQLAPFGLDPEVQALTVTLAREAAVADGLDPAHCEVLLAAHGSMRSEAPARVAQAMAEMIRAAGGFARAEAAFIDQAPQIATIARTMGPASLCLPFFAARGGHVIDDLPEALSEAGFGGRVLPPVGLDARVPTLIAAALRRAG
jgi:sirohydrochlorin ferrochelatase